MSVHSELMVAGVLLGGGLMAGAEELPPPVMRVADLRTGEQPVAVTSRVAVVAENAYFRRVRTEFVFVNPNPRQLAGDFEFPIPEGACVCGYRLEVNGEMVPGVVCEREQARVAFENEVRKGVDPGLVEQVKGNVWRTRVFPLAPQVPRRAEVDYVAPVVGTAATQIVYERDGDAWFAAAPAAAAPAARPVAERLRAFGQGYILWDASLSRLDKAAADRARLAANLPETGDWQLVAFANVPAAPRRFTAKAELLKAVDALVYDGGTDLTAALAAVPAGVNACLFTDELDTLSLKVPALEAVAGLFVASRPEAAVRPVAVWKLSAAEREALKGAAVAESTLLATVWAARRLDDLAAAADAHKDEFLKLARRYSVAGPGMSLIVFERLEQWLEHRIEPPDGLSCHAEWVRRRQAEDDAINSERVKSERSAALLRYWEERVKWWNDPKPKVPTPKSGLFDTVARSAAAEPVGQERLSEARAMRCSAAVANAPMDCLEAAGCALEDEFGAPAVKAGVGGGAPAAAAARPQVTLKAWDPETPYLQKLKAAPAGAAYAAYLQERAGYAASPAYFLDCAGWFFKAGETNVALRIISNLAEFKLGDAAIWRTMGWRLREAGCLDEAVLAFRQALAQRGEEGQSYRDLAIVLAERGKRDRRPADLEEAMRLLHHAAFEPAARRSGRRGNDLQVAVVALEELNALISWCQRQGGEFAATSVPELPEAYRRDLPLKLRIVMSWDADATDIDLHVLEPSGEEAYYGHRRTASGGFVSEDVTTGYGPEEYLRKELEPGTYKVLSNYYASHQSALTGPATVSVSVYTDWATADERLQILTLRLERPKDRNLIGEVTLGE